MNTDMVPEDSSEVRRVRVRFWLYWTFSVIATLIFVLFMVTMLSVPGVLPSTKIGMLSFAGLGAVVSLTIGLWNFTDSDAPVMAGFPGALMAVVLLLELLECAVSVFKLATRLYR